jgi:hypothetical protein
VDQQQAGQETPHRYHHHKAQTEVPILAQTPLLLLPQEVEGLAELVQTLDQLVMEEQARQVVLAAQLCLMQAVEAVGH